MADGAERAIGFCGGLSGALGVAASAAATHAYAGTSLDVAGLMLILHGAALLALAAAPPAARTTVRRAAALAMIVGVALFSGDLALRAITGAPLFPMAAPTGGVLLIAGWMMAGLAFAAGSRG